jgi:NHL repeat/WD40-like Beta Propeller Repeat
MFERSTSRPGDGSRRGGASVTVDVRRLVLLALASLCAYVGCVLLWGAPAQALEVHHFERSFGSEGSGPGQLKAPEGVAVNDVTHDVYVADTGNARVEEFGPTGLPIGEFTPPGGFVEPTEIAIDNSGSPLDPSREDVYVVDTGRGVIDKFSSSGAYLGQIVETPEGKFEPGLVAPRGIGGVAVDPGGTVWVSTLKRPIYSFSDGLVNEYVSKRETVFGGALEGLAVDGEDDLYVKVSGGWYAVVNSRGETLTKPPFGGDEEADRVAVDPVGGEVYLDNNDAIEAFTLGGEPIESDQAGAPFPAFASGLLTLSKGVAVDASNGTVYVSDKSADKVLVFEAILLPDVSIAPISDQQPRSLTLNGSVTPEGKPVGSCVFEYVAASEYQPGASNPYEKGVSVPCEPGTLGSGTASVPVKRHLEGLAPQTTYHYRLVAENVGGKSLSPDQQFFTGPRLGGESVSDVASSSATLQDAIDPNGGDTHYYIQYGLSTAYGSFAPVLPPGVDLGSAVGTQHIGVHLQSLEAGATYHYRFVAVQAGESFATPDGSFTTQGVGVGGGSGSGLLDGRAWELVSPASKKGALIEPFEGADSMQAASDGSGIAYLSRGSSPTENPAGKGRFSEVLSRRVPAGWASIDLTLPNVLPENGEPAEKLFTGGSVEYKLFSPDLSLAAVEPQLTGTPLLSPEATTRTLYVRDNSSGAFSPLVTPANVPAGTRIEEPTFSGAINSEWEMQFLAATPDLGHVVFKTPMALTPEAINEESIQEKVKKHEAQDGAYIQWNLYEWGGGELQLVNILPKNGGVAHGRYPAVPQVRLAGMIDNAAGYPRGGVQRSVSSDGRRVAWAWGEPYTPNGLEAKEYRGLYVRDMVEERTVRVGGARAVYQTMNSEGSEIFYLENGDLHVYNFGTGVDTDLTAAHGPGETNGGVQELVSDVSEDGSYVYFVATGVLANGGVSGSDNLYLLHDTGSGWTTTYIASLSSEDKPDWYGHAFEAPYLAHISSRVSPNGRYLAFMSERSLTSYDNTDAVSGQSDEEVYLYDAQTGKLVCASCDPTGARPVGIFDGTDSELLADRTELWADKESQPKDVETNHWLAGSIPGWNELANDPSTYQPRYLSDDGRLFFDSPDALVPHDTNGLEDVYEYEPVGEGTCTPSTLSGDAVYSGSAEGCVGLISSGTSNAESAFYDASESGDDVFFVTTSRLVSEDYDKSYDVYDAHVCTSTVPCRTSPVPPPPCDSGDSCKAAPTPQPAIFGAPPSATFNGAGNITPTPPVTVKKATKKTVKKCAKGKKLEHGKCVKRKQAKKVSARRRAK